MVLLPNYFTVPVIGGIMGVGLALQQTGSKKIDALKGFLMIRYGALGIFLGYICYTLTC
jgi:hypothetical protein